MAPTSNRVFVFIAGNKGSLLARAADAAAAARLLSGHLLYPLSHWHSLIEIAEGGRMSFTSRVMLVLVLLTVVALFKLRRGQFMRSVQLMLRYRRR